MDEVLPCPSALAEEESVIRGKDDHSFLGEAGPFKVLEHAADLRIDARDEPVVAPHRILPRLRVREPPLLADAPLVAVAKKFRKLVVVARVEFLERRNLHIAVKLVILGVVDEERRNSILHMGCLEAHRQAKRLALLASAQEFQNLVANHSCQVTRGALDFVEVLPLSRKPLEVVELIFRQGPSDAVLADEASTVTGIPESNRIAASMQFLGHRSGETMRAMAARIEPGEDRRARRSAKGGRNEVILEQHALAGEPIHVRRIDQVVACGSEHVPALVVSDDHDDVRRAGGSVRTGCECCARNRRGRATDLR